MDQGSVVFFLHGCGCEGEQQQEREREHPARVGVAVAVAVAAAAAAAAGDEPERRDRVEPERGEREHGRRAETCRLHARDTTGSRRAGRRRHGSVLVKRHHALSLQSGSRQPSASPRQGRNQELTAR
jgi:hypothetical protein